MQEGITYMSLDTMGGSASVYGRDVDRRLPGEALRSFIIGCTLPGITPISTELCTEL